MTLSLQIPGSQLEKIRAFLLEGGSREIGGWLVAEQINPGEFELVGLTVDFLAGTRDRFESVPEIHTDQLDRILSENSNRSGLVDYLGEWHSHPTFPTVPSEIDLTSMINMVEKTGPSFAVLVIVRLANSALIEATMTTFERGKPPAAGNLNAEFLMPDI